MPKKKSPAKKITPTTDTAATTSWLSTLNENEFRDRVLEYLFSKMKKAGVISWYKNIHGRNDKGVDYLLQVNSAISGSTVLGIQAKSQKIIRSSDSKDTSAVRILSECESAVKHTFEVENGRSKLDNIELWLSASITEDAENEFLAPAAQVRVKIKKAAQIAEFIEKYCPEYLRKIPDVSLALYVKKKKNPPSKSLRLLGTQLNPKDHFLSPLFSKTAPGSAAKLNSTNASGERIKSPPDPTLEEIVDHKNHTIIIGGDLSGKSYLLERIDYLIAERDGIPVLIDSATRSEINNSAIERAASLVLSFYRPDQIALLAESQTIHILIDDIDKIEPTAIAKLLSLDPSKYRIIATSKTWLYPKGDVFYMNGIDYKAMPGFLRSIDKELGEKSFVDRAHSFIGRTLATSGLTSNPFTVAVMLNECKRGRTQFSTPTLGRLIERFIELQIGSHDDDNFSVDYETKREFLIKLAGSQKRTWNPPAFTQQIGAFLGKKSHPHSLDVFRQEILESGVFCTKGNAIEWSHPVIMEYFWVRNVLVAKKETLILDRLKKNHAVSLAAICGSQLQNAGSLIGELTNELKNVKSPKIDNIVDTARGMTLLRTWAEGNGEEELLLNIESGKTHPLPPNEETVPDKQEDVIELTKEEKVEFRKKLDSIFAEITSGQYHIAHNLASLLVNARNTNTAQKEAAVCEIIRSNDDVSIVMQSFIKLIYSNRKRKQFIADWMRLYMVMQLTDQMIGDPFLVNIFKLLLPKQKSTSGVVCLLDLMLACGEDGVDSVVSHLKKLNRVEVTFALYLRLLGLYYYRFHKEREKKHIRELLKALRSIHKGLELPAIPTK